jgi:hypothetical protein
VEGSLSLSFHSDPQTTLAITSRTILPETVTIRRRTLTAESQVRPQANPQGMYWIGLFQINTSVQLIE